MLLHEHLEQQKADPKLVQLFSHLCLAAAEIARVIREEADVSHAGSQNIHGEHQLALDVQADDILAFELEESEVVSQIASEEQEEIVTFDVENGYAVAYDPLDGSSLVDVNLAIGTIFGIYKGKLLGQYGEKQIASGFFVYGPRVTLVYTLGKGVFEFTMLKNGDFVLTKEQLTIEPEAKQFAPGNLRGTAENPQYKALISDWMERKLTLRYSGGMVPDINQIFLKGHGIFAYPGDSKHPNGKLRLLYECAPFALLAEAAGGKAVDVTGKRILSKQILDLHERTTIFIGSSGEVDHAVKMLK